MQTLSDAQDLARIVRALQAANKGDGYTVKLMFVAGDSDEITPRVLEAEWGQSETPITLDATLAGYLPRRLLYEPISVFVEVDGVPIPQLIGVKSACMPSDTPFSSDLLSSSAGSLLAGDDAVKLAQITDYPDTPPDRIVWDVVKRLPYNKSRISIEKVPGVLLNLVGSSETPGFQAHEAAGDVLERLSATQTVGYRYRDTASGGLIAWVPRPLSALDASATDIAVKLRSYEARALPDWQAQRPQPPLVRYSEVRVYCNNTDGRLLYEYIEEVPYPPNVRRPYANTRLEIPFEDASDSGPANARLRAVNEALAIARAASTGDELTLPAYDPLLEVSDTLTVVEPYRDEDGLFEIRWGMRAESYKHMFGSGTSAGSTGGSLDTAISYEAVLLDEERIQVPALIVPAPSSGVIQTPRDSYALVGDDIYFDTPIDWVTPQGDDLIFDSNAPARIDPAKPDELIVEQG